MSNLLRWVLVCLLALCGCERGGLRTVVGEVELSAGALHFQTAYLGFPKAKTLRLRNGSRSDRRLTVATEAPFLADESVLVPGGAQVELAVTLVATELGPASGRLTLGDGVHTFEVALDGEVAGVPVCIPSADCRLSTFDGVSCVEATAADGAECTSGNACLEGGSCSKGMCVGSARDCSDTDPCTDDACQPGGGCVHYPKVCGAPSDPCKVASCDPGVGCVERDAQDGAACGPADCVTAKICLGGSCKAVAVPDGAVCSPVTACQGAGTCQQQQCVKPEARPLVEAWSYAFPGPLPSFRGVMDSVQNLYWFECGIGGLIDTCSATSVTRDGAIRFQQVLPELPVSSLAIPHLLAGGHLVYALGADLGSVSSGTGALEWTLALPAALQGGPDLADQHSVRFLVADASGQIYAVIQRSLADPQGSVARQDALLKVDSRTGAVVARRFFAAQTSGGVVDEHDNLFLGAWVTGPGPQLFSLSPAGVERFRLDVQGEPTPIAAYNGEVTLRRGEVRSAFDGSLRATAPEGSPMRNVLMGSTARTFVHQPMSYGCCEACECKVPSYAEVDVVSFAPGASAASWETPVASTSGVTNYVAVSDSAFERQGDILLAASANLAVSKLFALTNSGAERFACEIPPGPMGTLGYTRYSSAAALLNGRWAVVEQIECRNCTHNPLPRLRMFEVPGVAPATRGWVSAGGNPSGGARPLP